MDHDESSLQILSFSYHGHHCFPCLPRSWESTPKSIFQNLLYPNHPKSSQIIPAFPNLNDHFPPNQSSQLSPWKPTIFRVKPTFPFLSYLPNSMKKNVNPKTSDQSSKIHTTSSHTEVFPGGTPVKKGWFLLGKLASRDGWFGRTPHDYGTSGTYGSFPMSHSHHSPPPTWRIIQLTWRIIPLSKWLVFLGL